MLSKGTAIQTLKTNQHEQKQLCKGLSKVKQIVCKYEQNLKQKDKTILANNGQNAVFDLNNWPTSAKSVQGVQYEIVRLKYSVSSAVCTHWTTLVHCLIAPPFCTTLHSFCTHIAQTAHFMNPQYCKKVCYIFWKAKLATFAIQKFYCTVLQILLNIVNNVGLT